MARQPSRSFILWTLICASIPARVALAADLSCYFPNGKLADEWVPCSDDTYASCCHKTAICLSNNFCMGIRPAVLARGACTDPNWQSNNCTPFCKDVNPWDGASLVLFYMTNDVPSYCCNYVIQGPDNKTQCDKGESPFNVPIGTPIAGRGALATMAVNTSSATTTPSPTGSPTGGATHCTSSCPATEESHGTAIGVGVGVPLGLIAAGLLAWALWERRRRMGAEKGVVTGRPTDGEAGAVKYPTSVTAPSQQTVSSPPAFDPSHLPVLPYRAEMYGERDHAELQ